MVAQSPRSRNQAARCRSLLGRRCRSIHLKARPQIPCRRADGQGPPRGASVDQWGGDPGGATMDQDQIYAELDRVRDDFRGRWTAPPSASCVSPPNGTKWNNEQLLFHMLLLGISWCGTCGLIVWGFSQLPDSASRRFAFRALTGHPVNLPTSSTTSAPLRSPRVGLRADQLMDRVVTGLQRSLRAHQMSPWLGACTSRWAGTLPGDFATLLEVYHYPTQHYDHHRRRVDPGRSARQGWGDPLSSRARGTPGTRSNSTVARDGRWRA